MGIGFRLYLLTTVKPGHTFYLGHITVTQSREAKVQNDMVLFHLKTIILEEYLLLICDVVIYLRSVIMLVSTTRALNEVQQTLYKLLLFFFFKCICYVYCLKFSKIVYRLQTL